MITLPLVSRTTLALVLATTLVVGCGSDGDEGGTAGSSGSAQGGQAGTSAGSSGAAGSTAGSAGSSAGGTGGTGGTGGSAGTGGSGGAPALPKASVRAAHFSSDAPAIDVCVDLKGGTAPVGPLFAAVAGGLKYGDVSAFAEVEGTAITRVHLIEPGKDCSAPIQSFDLGEKALVDGASSTLVAVGSVAAAGTEALQIKAYDHNFESTNSQARVELFHTAPGVGSVDVKTASSEGSLSSLFDAVSFPSAKEVLVVGAGGVKLVVGASPLSKLEEALLVLSPIDLNAGTTTSLFAVGDSDDDPKPLAVVACNDALPAENGLSKCAVVPEVLSQVRLAHLSPDAPAVDVCLRYGNSEKYVGPLLDSALSAGLAYSQVSQFVPVQPGRVSQVRLVAADAADCSTGLLDTEVDLTLLAGATTTLAATGEVTAGAAQPLALQSFATTTKATKAGTAHLDVIHAAVGAGAVDVVAVGEASALVPVTENLAYGAAAVVAEVEPVEGVTLAVGANPFTDSKNALLTLQPTDLKADSALTLFAIGNASDSPKPLSILACDEGAAPEAGLSKCAILPELNAMLRVAHLSPNAPPIDACLSTDNGKTFVGPLLKGAVPNGLKYKDVAQYLEASIGTYTTLRLINPDNNVCDLALVPDISLTGAQLLAGEHYTVSVFGELGSLVNGKKLTVSVLSDKVTPVDGKLTLRFINEVSGVAPLELGVVGASDTTLLFPGLAYGQAADYSDLDALSNVTLAIGADLMATPPKTSLTLKPLSFEAGQVVTTFAIGAPVSDGGKPLEILSCTDSSTDETGGLAKCVTLEKL